MKNYGFNLNGYVEIQADSKEDAVTQIENYLFHTPFYFELHELNEEL